MTTEQDIHEIIEESRELEDDDWMNNELIMSLRNNIIALEELEIRRLQTKCEVILKGQSNISRITFKHGETLSFEKPVKITGIKVMIK